ncbi:MAG: DUF3300 domain-containing protein [Wenzhouxiangella sp.]
MKATPLLLMLALTASLLMPRPAAAEPPIFSQAELDQMLAPVALYPDSVLSHVLIAATYPLEVIQAARWSAGNPDLSGEIAVEMVAEKSWDPSVMALVAFPSLLARMNDDIDWTYRLGDAFLFQEAAVIDTIQQLRSRAWDHGHLQSNEQVRVVRETRYITIEPARTRVVYVPVYDPRVVYGPWWWQTHPPVFWHHPRPSRSRVVVYWGPSYHVPPSFYFSAFHWPQRQVFVVHHHHHYHHFHPRSSHRFHAHSSREVIHHSQARHWQHDPTHRRGVSYRQTPPDHRLVQQRAGTPARQVQARDSQRAWAGQQRQQSAISQRSAVSDVRRQASSAAPQSRRLESDGARQANRSAGAAESRPRAAAQSASSRPTHAATQNRVATRPSAAQAPATDARIQSRQVPSTNPAAARSVEQRSQSRSAQTPSRTVDARASSAAPQSASPASQTRQPMSRASSEPAGSRAPISTQRPAQSNRQAGPRASAPSAQAGPSRQAPPSRQSAPAPQAAPSRQAAPPRQSAPSRQVAPSRQAAPTSSRSAPASSARPSSGSARSADRPRTRGEQQ